jgi:hypothetical protein
MNIIVLKLPSGNILLVVRFIPSQQRLSQRLAALPFWASHWNCQRTV